MGDVERRRLALDDPEVLELLRRAVRDGAAHPEHRACRRGGPVLVHLPALPPPSASPPPSTRAPRPAGRACGIPRRASGAQSHSGPADVENDPPGGRPGRAADRVDVPTRFPAGSNTGRSSCRGFPESRTSKRSGLHENGADGPCGKYRFQAEATASLPRSRLGRKRRWSSERSDANAAWSPSAIVLANAASARRSSSFGSGSAAESGGGEQKREKEGIRRMTDPPRESSHGFGRPLRRCSGLPQTVLSPGPFAGGGPKMAGDGQVRTGVLGTGSHVPDRIVDNRELAGALRVFRGLDPQADRDPGAPLRRPRVAASDLGLLAARQALDAAGSSRRSSTSSSAHVHPDMAFPSTACLIQDRLGAQPAASFDLQAACSGFVYALVTAGAVHRDGRRGGCSSSART